MDGNKFYTSTASGWLEVRKQAILESGGKCERCGVVYTDTKKLVGHHIDPLKGNDYSNPKKALNFSNIQVLCKTCHNQVHDRFKNNKEVIIVYGSPLSGKTSFVKANKDDDDLVVDIDALYSAVTLKEFYDKPGAIRFNVFALKNMLIDNIKTKYGSWKTAWVIGGYANKYEREKLAKDLNAELILVESTREECLLRLEKCKDHRNVFKDEWTKYINEWFDTYTPPSK